MGTYSIVYPNYFDLSYEECAVDWNWHFRDKWARSKKQGPSSTWIPEEGLDTKAYEELLKHFSLEQWADEFPPEHIISMSPYELAKERRRKEEKYQLSKKVMTSDTIGYHAQAKDHGLRGKDIDLNNNDQI